MYSYKKFKPQPYTRLGLSRIFYFPLNQELAALDEKFKIHEIFQQN